MAVLPAGKGNAGDDMAAAVIAVLKGSVFFLSDGSLLLHRRLTLAVSRPVIGCVINVPLLLEGSLIGQNIPVFIIICAQVIELPRRADADQLRCSGFGRQRSLGKMGVVVVGLARRAAYHQLRVEAGRDRFDLLHQIRRQGKQVVGLFCTGLVGDLNGDLVLRFQFIGVVINCHGYIISRQVVLIDYAVAVALHRFRRGQRLNVRTEEAVAAILIQLIVHQRAVFKLRLPVTVMGQILQLGIGIQRQAQTFHQVVGIGIAVLSGEGIIRRGRSEQLFRVCGVQILIAFLFADGRFRRFAEIVHSGEGAAFLAAGIGCRSVCQPFSGQR